MNRRFVTACLLAASFTACGKGSITGLGDGARQIDKLAFVRDGQIFTSGPRTSHLKAITEAGGYSSPTWSPDGRLLAYVGVVSDGPLSGHDNLTIIEPDGANPTVLFEGEVKDGLLAWTPDGSRIAFLGNTAQRAQNEGRILIVDTHTGEIQSESPDDIRGQQPQWSPMLDRLYFVGVYIGADRPEHNTWHIYYVDTASFSPTRLTDSPTNDILPSVSPDGRRIAYLATNDGLTSLLVRDVDNGGASEVVASEPIANYRPLWGPDGRWLAFVSRGQIFRVPASGGDPHQVTREKANYRLVSFSPDGNYVVFTANLEETGLVQDGSEVYVLDLSTGISEQVLDFGAELDVLWKDR